MDTDTPDLQHPFCTVVMPCRNEIRFIARCLESLLANDYPADRLEIVVIDGASTDGTRELLARYAAQHRHLTVLDNPRGIIPVSLNLGIRRARGAIVLRTDAHADYPHDYISRCVRALLDSGADNVGGVLDTRPSDHTATGRAIARVLSHVFGAGNSRFRIGSAVPIEVDTVAFGCYRREALERVGGYNEALVRSSDMDLNSRLRRAGGRIRLFPDIVLRYYPLAVFWPFVWRNAIDGFWATYPLKFGGEVLRPRHVAPAAALALIALLTVVASAVPAVWWLVSAAAGSYAIAALGASLQIGLKDRSARVGVIAAAVFVTRHAAYALGSLWGLGCVAAGRLVGGAPAAGASRPGEGLWARAELRQAGALSVVIPAFNEERRLPSAIAAFDDYLRPLAVEYELIVVDDGSTDGTAAVVTALAEQHRCLRLIQLPINSGKGAAVKAGMLAASGRWILFSDADQSVSIDQLPAVLEPLLEGYAIAIASRGLPDSTFLAQQPWYRRGLGRAFGMLAKTVLVRGFSDCQCGFKAFTREAATAIFARLTSSTAIFDMEVLLLSARHGFRVAEVPVEWRHDADSRLVYDVRGAMALVRELLRLRRDWRVGVAERARVTAWTVEREAREASMAVMPHADRGIVGRA